MSERLEKCPFCNSDGVVRETGIVMKFNGLSYKAKCSNEDCLVMPYVIENKKGGLITKEEAIKAWNTRTPLKNKLVIDVEGLEDEIIAVGAQGYCTKRNENKVVDPCLLEDVGRAIINLLKSKGVENK